MAYSKHEWNDGELITKDLMNNIEKGIESVENNAVTIDKTLTKENQVAEAKKVGDELSKKVNLPAGGNGTDGQVLVTAGDGTTRWENKPADGAKGEKGEQGEQGLKGDKGEPGAKGADGKRGSIWTVGTALAGEATDKTVPSSGLDSSLLGDMYLNSTTFEAYKCTKDGNASVATWTKIGVIKGKDGTSLQQLDHINNATGSSDAHTVLNSLLAGLIAKGFMKGA